LTLEVGKSTLFCDVRYDEAEIAAVFSEYVIKNGKFLGLQTEGLTKDDFFDFRFDYSQPFVVVKFQLRQKTYAPEFVGTFDRCGRLELSH
jgi:hypothetical protein